MISFAGYSGRWLFYLTTLGGLIKCCRLSGRQRPHQLEDNAHLFAQHIPLLASSCDYFVHFNPQSCNILLQGTDICSNAVDCYPNVALLPLPSRVALGRCDGLWGPGANGSIPVFGMLLYFAVVPGLFNTCVGVVASGHARIWR